MTQSERSVLRAHLIFCFIKTFFMPGTLCKISFLEEIYTEKYDQVSRFKS